MKNSIAISSEEYSLLNRYIGQGSSDSSLIIFGNEPGTAGEFGVSETIDYLKDFDTGEVFTIPESYTHPTTSDFARFSARLALALQYKEYRFLGELSSTGKVRINEHIYTRLSEKSMALINLRPLPRPTQDTWVYSNIDKKEYNRKWNFGLKRHQMTPDVEVRSDGLKEFILSKKGIIVGVGDKENKKAFLEKILKEKFIKKDLDSHSIYYHPELKIYLSNYFNNRNGIKISGLKELYEFMKDK